jgi:cell division protein FtsW (lipid II flippase)
MSDTSAPSPLAGSVQPLPESHTDFVFSLVLSNPLLLAGALLLGAVAITSVFLLMRRRGGSSKGE